MYVALGTAYRNQAAGDGYVNNHMRAIKINDVKPDFCDEICLPPLAKPKRNGRHQKKRKEKGDRPEKTQGPQACTRCGQTGHNKKNARKCSEWRPH